MKTKVPKAIQHGHKNLQLELKSIIAEGGKIGEKAKILSDMMISHFEKEEKYALPPLGLLLTLSEGNWKIEKNEAIRMADTLQAKLSEMTKEHEYISKLLQNLKIAADEENNSQAKYFVKNLTLHVELEDQVLYPATILIGNYLKKIST